MSTVQRTVTSMSCPPQPTNSYGHTLLFYEDDSALLETISQSICTAICSGNSALVVATAAHHNGLVTHLRAHCVRINDAIIEGRLFLLDADEILARLMVDGQLNPDHCIHVIGNLVSSLLAAARGEDPYVFAFGELVALLWERGNQTSALDLELLCRQVSENPSLRLCCGYPLSLFPSDDASPGPILKISSRQTRLVGSKDSELISL